ncbi:hypothetical protein ACG2F4_19295 [Halalkalibaculum sp. DA3122]|uniref:hypothetical protein n=1 Tax=Halalkalibaculum sp. DA3122 TaxID=3373607 RepID=UPI0037547CB7
MMDEVATIWMKKNNINQKTIEAVKSSLRYSKQYESVLDYKVKDLINDLEKGIIQQKRGIGFKKIEELFNKLQADGLAKEYKLTSTGRVRRKWFGLF